METLLLIVFGVLAAIMFFIGYPKLSQEDTQQQGYIFIGLGFLFGIIAVYFAF